MKCPFHTSISLNHHTSTAANPREVIHQSQSSFPSWEFANMAHTYLGKFSICLFLDLEWMCIPMSQSWDHMILVSEVEERETLRWICQSSKVFDQLRWFLHLEIQRESYCLHQRILVASDMKKSLHCSKNNNFQNRELYHIPSIV